MNKVNDLMLFESVILHCQILHNITGTKEALVAAQKDGLIDFYNQLTSAGRNVGYMMLADVEEYEKLFDVEVKKTPDFFDQQATHPPIRSNCSIVSQRLFRLDRARMTAPAYAFEVDKIVEQRR